MAKTAWSTNSMVINKCYYPTFKGRVVKLILPLLYYRLASKQLNLTLKLPQRQLEYKP